MFKLSSYRLHPIKRVADETGAALLITMFLSLILLTVAASYLAFTTTERSISRIESDDQRAFEAAEAGIDIARAKLAKIASISGGTFGNLTSSSTSSSYFSTVLGGVSPKTITFGDKPAAQWQAVPYTKGSKYQIIIQNNVRAIDSRVPGYTADPYSSTDPMGDTDAVVYVISRGLVPFGNFTTFSGNFKGIVRTVEVRGNLETVWKHVVSTPNNPTYTTTGGSTTLTYASPASATSNGPKQFGSSMFPTPDLSCYETLAKTPPGTFVSCAGVNSIGGAFITINVATDTIVAIDAAGDATMTVHIPASGSANNYITAIGSVLSPSGTLSYNAGSDTVTIDKSGGNDVKYDGVIYIKFTGTSASCSGCLVDLKNDVTINGVLVVENGKVSFSGHTELIPPVTTGGSCTAATQRFPALIVYDTDPTGTSSYPNFTPPDPANCTSGTVMVDAGNTNLRICGVTFSNGAVAANPYNLGVNPPCDPTSGGGNIVTTGCLNTQGNTTLNYPKRWNLSPPWLYHSLDHSETV